VTLREFLDRRDEKRQRAFSDHENSGLFLGFLKRVSSWGLLNYFWRQFARWKLSPRLNDEVSDAEADQLVKRMLEVYSMVWMGVLVAFYVALLQAISFGFHFAIWGFALPAVIVAFYRLVEILSFSVELHARDKYETKAQMRAVARTIWHYLECVVSFGTFYVTAYLWGDAFSTRTPPPFLESWVTPLYFSFVTITTLGYGDFSPQRWFGQILVMVEVLTGLVLFLVVLQRALSAAASPSQVTQRDGPDND
jgi:hypothetical protein